MAKRVLALSQPPQLYDFSSFNITIYLHNDLCNIELLKQLNIFLILKTKKMNPKYGKSMFIGLLVSIGVLLLIAEIVKAVNNVPKTNLKANVSNVSKSEQAKIGDLIEVGNFVYKVKEVGFSKHLGNEFVNETADGIFLVVWLSVKNITKESRTVDNMLFKLTDDTKTEYEASQTGITALEMSGEKTLFLKQCQPNITTSGFIVFEVPEKGVYNLQLSGGFFDSKTASVRLSK